MTKNAIVRGRSPVEHGRNLVVAGEAPATLQADMDFHAFVSELSGNPIIGETMRMHRLHLRRAMGPVLRYPGMSISVRQEHGRVLEQMIAGDAAGASDLMRRHVVDAYERVRIEPGSASGTR